MASGSTQTSVSGNKTDEIQRCNGNPPSRSSDISLTEGEENSSQAELLHGSTNMENIDPGTDAMGASQPTDDTEPGNLLEFTGTIFLFFHDFFIRFFVFISCH